MPSRRTLWFRRHVPRGIRNPLKRARGMLLMNKRLLEHAERETFFHHAFRALRFNGIDGDYAEFGCHGGKTFALAGHYAKRLKHRAHLWAFDSFQGLPEQKDALDRHRWWQPGKMATSLEEFHRLCEASRIPRSAYTAVAGFYDETLDKMAPDAAPTNIGLAYIDCDLYSSTMSVLRFLEPRLKHGMILACDDYYCWSEDQVAGERRALRDHFEGHPRWSLLPYLPIGWHGASFVVEDRTLLGAGAGETER